MVMRMMMKMRTVCGTGGTVVDGLKTKEIKVVFGWGDNDFLRK